MVLLHQQRERQPSGFGISILPSVASVKRLRQMHQSERSKGSQMHFIKEGRESHQVW